MADTDNSDQDSEELHTKFIQSQMQAQQDVLDAMTGKLTSEQLGVLAQLDRLRRLLRTDELHALLEFQSGAQPHLPRLAETGRQDLIKSAHSFEAIWESRRSNHVPSTGDAPFPPGPPPVATLSAQARQHADSLFLYHPLQITALVETFWRHRYNAVSGTTPHSPFVPWPTKFTREILHDDYLLGFDFSSNNGFPLSEFLPGKFSCHRRCSSPAYSRVGITPGANQLGSSHLRLSDRKHPHLRYFQQSAGNLHVRRKSAGSPTSRPNNSCAIPSISFTATACRPWSGPRQAGCAATRSPTG